MAKEIFRTGAMPDRDWEEDFNHENGNYMCNCVTCGNTFYGHKRRVQCKVCAYPRKEGDPILDFTSILTYVQSLQREALLSDDEAGTMYHILNMWQKKRYFEPTTYKLSEINSLNNG